MEGQAASNSARPAQRQLLLAAAWALPAFLLLPILAAIPSIASFYDPENYLWVHSFMEAFSCAVSVLIFRIGLYAADADRSVRMAVLSTAFLSVALLDFAHILSYEGMPGFVTAAGAEKAIEFWLAARYAEAAGLLVFVLFPGTWRIGERGPYAFVAVSLAYTALVYWAVLVHPEALPRTFLPGTGLTQFKVMAEYGVIALHVMTAAALLARPPGSLDFPLPMLFTAVLLLVASELAVTLYATVQDAFNLIGHVYKVVAFGLIYRAVFVYGVSTPYQNRVTSERLYRRFTEQAADAIFRLDGRGRILTANPRAEQLTGRRKDEMLGASLANFLDSDGGERLIRCVGALPLSGGAMFEALVTHADDTVTPAEISIGPLDEKGSIAIARDVSERKRSEEAVRIRDISFASSITPIAIADLGGRLSYANRAFLDLWAYDSEREVLGRGIGDFLEDPDLAREIVHALQVEGVWNSEMRGARRDGTVIDVQVASNMVRGQDGAPICMIGSFKDITQQKAVSQILRKNEELLRAAAEAAGIGIYDHDHQTDTIYWSPEQRVNYGIGADEVVTLEFFLASVHPDDREIVAAAVQRAHEPAGDGRFDVEHRIIRRDGSVRRLITRGRTFFAGEGRSRHPIRTVGAVFDVTERVRAAEERSALELQLVQAQKMEAVGQLTGGMAHDFNNLLGVIIGNLDALCDRKRDDSVVTGLAGEARDAAMRGADLTRSLLAFARRQPLQPRPVELNELIAGIIRLLRRTLGENIETVVDAAPQLWPIVADPAQLEASLTNLATNARDAMQPKGGRLTIATRNCHLEGDYVAQHPGVIPGDYVMIEVNDTGCGMPPEVTNRIFDPFFTTKETGKGSGLGLSMVFGFLRQSGGHIHVDSEVGVGTTFRLYLPRAEKGAEAEVRPAVASVVGGRGETVLAVEDNAALRRVATLLLKELGYRVIQAETAAAALGVLEREPIDLLFSDVILPGGVTGIELSRIARERWPRLRVVLTSGFPDANLDGSHGSPQDIRLLNKPYRKRDLARILREALDT